MHELQFPTLYVSRTVPLPASDVARALARLPATIGRDATWLAVDRSSQDPHPVLFGPPRPSLRAVIDSGRLRPRFLVEVEATPWSSDTTEIGIRPLGRSCRWWPSRFCGAAHTIVDHLADLLLAQAVRAGAAVPAPDQLRRAS